MPVTLPTPLREYADKQDGGLVWLPELGMGYYPVHIDVSPYDRDYWDKYVTYAQTALGRRLTRFRVELVNRWVGAEHATIVDVGIGAGQFLEAMQSTGRMVYGYDVNPVALRWLGMRDMLVRFWDPDVQWDTVTFWDSLEHLPDPGAALARARIWAFVTLPIFRDAEHILSSKHFRRDEHLWYWTRAGFLRWADAHGFRCVEHLTTESLMGREDVETFVLARR